MAENIEDQSILVAPCGMNCAICSCYLALKNDLRDKGFKINICAGCRPRNKKCAFIIKKCKKLLKKEIDFCYQCSEFPCINLKHLDERYRKFHRMSMIENLETIREEGMGSFLEKEQQKWRCPDCGSLITCHNGICYSCHPEDLKKKKQIYRWE